MRGTTLKCLWHALASMGMLFGIWLLAGAQLLTMLCKMIQPCSTLSIYSPQATSDIQEWLYASLHVCFHTQTWHTFASDENVKEYWSFLFLHISVYYIFLLTCHSIFSLIAWPSCLFPFYLCTFWRVSPLQTCGQVFISWVNTSDPGTTSTVWPLYEIVVLCTAKKVSTTGTGTF